MGKNYINHHYVPEWYQRGFFHENQTNYFYLDKNPEIFHLKNGEIKRSKQILERGVKACFCKDHLYSIFSATEITVLEKYFFGRIDKIGSEAFPIIKDNKILYHENGHLHFHNFIEYMDIQRLRTPKGLKWIKDFIYKTERKSKLLDERALREYILQKLTQIKKIHITMWTEGIWEIVSAEKSDTKFIVSDNPVTFYNPKIFPLNKNSYGFNNIYIDLIGTRTIFPLDMNHCLIITNRQYALNPGKKHLKERLNARVFSASHFDATSIITGRNLSEDEVKKINFILKKTAERYVASANIEWLQSEKKPPDFFWTKIDEILLPDKRKITRTIQTYIGGDDFFSGLDVYGRPLPKEEIEKIKNTHERLKRTAPGSKILAE